MKLYFYGGAKSVTGANYLLDTGDLKILIDCGLFQGSKYAEILNYEKFSYDPATVDYVLITHSHTDHTGRIPKLYKEGFRGKIYATNPSIDLMKAALPNNYGLIKDEAVKDNHEPLFDMEDLNNSFNMMQGYDLEEKISLGSGVKVIFHEAGHILGSAIVEIIWSDGDRGKKNIFFTGDLGNPPMPLLNTPFYPQNADYAVIESAYGSRIHENKLQRKELMASIIKETIAMEGIIMIPSFAMERTQELLYEINEMIREGQIPKIPVFLDSPLAIKLTEVYRKYWSKFNKEAVADFKDWGGLFRFPSLTMTKTVDDSKSINDVRGSKIIIAGSGMSMGGRILHHERRYLPDPNSTILFVGYQVEGSLGRRILEGANKVKIFGGKVIINCRVEAIGGYSAHADQVGLLEWVRNASIAGNLKKVFIVQGEEESVHILADRIKTDLSIDAVAPNQGEDYEL